MDNETAQPPGQTPQRPEGIEPLNNEQITARLFVLEKLLSVSLYCSDLLAMRAVDSLNLEGVQRIVGGHAAYLDQEFEGQSEALEKIARAYVPQILGPLIFHLNQFVSRPVEAEKEDPASPGGLTRPKRGPGGETLQ
jgi:hypothetical protein